MPDGLEVRKPGGEAEDTGRVRWRTVMSFAKAALVTFAVFFVVGNLVIVGASFWIQRSVLSTAPTVEGVSNFRVVDDHMWRGAAPSPEGYRSLAEAGVVTIIDLRSEENLDRDVSLLKRLDLRVVSIPVRDGQAPTASAVDRLLATLRDSAGVVFVHCGAGVGRVGTMAAVYLATTGQADGVEALVRNLAIGPPSLEQIAFVAGLHGTDIDRPNAALVAVSRVLDAPRRLWSRLGV